MSLEYLKILTMNPHNKHNISILKYVKNMITLLLLLTTFYT